MVCRMDVNGCSQKWSSTVLYGVCFSAIQSSGRPKSKSDKKTSHLVFHLVYLHTALHSIHLLSSLLKRRLRLSSVTNLLLQAILLYRALWRRVVCPFNDLVYLDRKNTLHGKARFCYGGFPCFSISFLSWIAPITSY